MVNKLKPFFLQDFFLSLIHITYKKKKEYFFSFHLCTTKKIIFGLTGILGNNMYYQVLVLHFCVLKSSFWQAAFWEHALSIQEREAEDFKNISNNFSQPRRPQTKYSWSSNFFRNYLMAPPINFSFLFKAQFQGFQQFQGFSFMHQISHYVVP